MVTMHIHQKKSKNDRYACGKLAKVYHPLWPPELLLIAYSHVLS